MDWALLLGGGLLLFWGAEWFVGGASTLALALRVPQILVGLTVVAYGTSAPEVIVGVQAASAGHSEVALGNVLGSNIANIGLILGLAAVLRPAKVDPELRRRELPVLLLSAGVVPVFLLDGVIALWEAAALLLAALVYTVLMVRAAHSAAAVATASSHAEIAAEVADAAGGPTTTGKLRSSAVALVGLAVLLAGGDLFVRGAVAMAHSFGMSERLVGLTIVALGTSLPELITSLVAARRGHSDIVVGNVVGSNIFNVLLCLGASGVAGHVGASLGTLALDLVVFVAMTILAAVFIRSERVISRTEGTIVLVGYFAFMAVSIVRG